MNKKADIWVSAVLYIALGVIVITLILAAGVPLINKMRDRNTLTQTKLLMGAIDENIKIVMNEGPGSKRVLSPLNINSGEINVNEENITWSLTTKNKLMEPGISFDEGSLIIHMDETDIVDEYKLNIEMDYKNKVTLNLTTKNNPLSGNYKMVIEHRGTYSKGVPDIAIEMA